LFECKKKKKKKKGKKQKGIKNFEKKKKKVYLKKPFIVERIKNSCTLQNNPFYYEFSCNPFFD